MIARSEPFSNREFSTSDIVSEGKKVIERFLDDKNEGGYIDFVKLMIFETRLVDGRVLQLKTPLQFKWKQP